CAVLPTYGSLLLSLPLSLPLSLSPSLFLSLPLSFSLSLSLSLSISVSLSLSFRVFLSLSSCPPNLSLSHLPCFLWSTALSLIGIFMQSWQRRATAIELNLKTISPAGMFYLSGDSAVRGHECVCVCVCVC